MDISTLDEYQGIEAQMVRDWMTRKGCYRQDGYWRHPRDKYSYTDGEYGGLLWEDTLFKLSVDFGFGSVQSLLREINPRMRKGMPSEAAWRAHGEANGLWLCLWGQIPTNEQHWEMFFRGRPFVTKIRKYDAMWEWGIRGLSWSDCPEMPHGSDFLFWPCDEHGNKTRWPTDAEGKML